jgi:hypothetical protein
MAVCCSEDDKVVRAVMRMEEITKKIRVSLKVLLAAKRWKFLGRKGS